MKRPAEDEDGEQEGAPPAKEKRGRGRPLGSKNKEHKEKTTHSKGSNSHLWTEAEVLVLKGQVDFFLNKS